MADSSGKICDIFVLINPIHHPPLLLPLPNSNLDLWLSIAQQVHEPGHQQVHPSYPLFGVLSASVEPDLQQITSSLVLINAVTPFCQVRTS